MIIVKGLLQRVWFERSLIFIAIHLFASIFVADTVFIFVNVAIYICRVRILHDFHRISLEEKKDSTTRKAYKKRYKCKVF